MDAETVEIEWGKRPLRLETGRIARQADAAVLATYGETSVLATVVAMKQERAGIDFFPLTVNYQEKTFAAGKIPGGYFKREGRPTEKETLTSRLIDRPIRPLFVKGFKNEVQVVATVLAHDLENDPDIIAMIAASAALVISGAPFMGPIGGARVGFIDGEYVLNPTLEQLWEGQVDVTLRGPAGRRIDCELSLFEREGHEPIWVLRPPPLPLPIDPELWRSWFTEHIRDEAKDAYDTARICEVLFRAEEIGALVDRHVEHIGDALAAEQYLQGLAVVAPALADVALDIDVRQKVHLDLDDAVALTGLALRARCPKRDRVRY